MDVTRTRFSHFTSEQHLDLKKTFEETEAEIAAVVTDVAAIPEPKVIEVGGNLFFDPALPTADPEVAGALYTALGVVTVSAG